MEDIVSKKNWPLALEIMNKLNNNYNTLKFLVVLGTDGTEENKSAATEYINLIKKELGDNKVYDFINITNKEMINIYHMIDIFILTSSWESFGRTAVEAMALKNVVVGTDVDGLKEVIGNEEFLFETASQATDIIDRLIEEKK